MSRFSVERDRVRRGLPEISQAKNRDGRPFLALPRAHGSIPGRYEVEGLSEIYQPVDQQLGTLGVHVVVAGSVNEQQLARETSSKQNHENRTRHQACKDPGPRGIRGCDRAGVRRAV